MKGPSPHLCCAKQVAAKPLEMLASTSGCSVYSSPDGNACFHIWLLCLQFTWWKCLSHLATLFTVHLMEMLVTPGYSVYSSPDGNACHTWLLCLQFTWWKCLSHLATLFTVHLMEMLVTPGYSVYSSPDGNACHTWLLCLQFTWWKCLSHLATLFTVHLMEMLVTPGYSVYSSLDGNACHIWLLCSDALLTPLVCKTLWQQRSLNYQFIFFLFSCPFLFSPPPISLVEMRI